MDDVARLSPDDRVDLFRSVAAKRGLSDAIVEKDFWVCWVLKRVFSLENPPAGILFKGGTSLSKVYKLIDRFSEDVDLSFDRAGLGFGGDADPMKAPSRKRREAAVEELAKACRVAVREKLKPQLAASFAMALGTTQGWSLESATDDPDDATLLFAYPSSPVGQLEYVRPLVRLELGARADHWPAQPGTILPFAAEEYPGLFKSPVCEVNVLAAERTFWEKATLLHAWYHAGADRRYPDRQSRHFYDLYRLSQSPVRERALGQLSLLSAVAQHKQIFFAQAWAKYELAKPGTLRLVPPTERLGALERDYAAMRQMMFGAPPSFGAILEGLGELESRINELRSP
jgi:hypothetical protein